MLNRLISFCIESVLFAFGVVDATKRQLGNAYAARHGDYS